MTHRWRAVAIAMSVFVALSMPDLSRASGEGLTYGFYPGAPVTSEYTASGKCRTHVTDVWSKELGTSGITQLKAKFQLRGKYDPGIPGLAYQTSGWLYSNEFPNDFKSYWRYWGWYFLHPPNGEYSVHATFVGVRPGLFNKDRKRKAILGVINCQSGATLT